MFAHGRQVAQIDREVRSGISVEQTRYIHADHLGSSSAFTNETGLVVHVQRFDAFGAPENPTAQAADVPTRNLRAGYTGHEMDSETGLVNMRGRIYDPRLGRFLQPDPFLRPNSSQGLNRYSYAFNNPLRWIDPSGSLPEDEETGTVDSAGDGDVGNGDVDEEFPFPPISAGGESGSESGGEDGSVSGGEEGSEPGGEEGSEPGGEEGSEPGGEETVCGEEDFESTEKYEDYSDDSEYESQSTPRGEGTQSDGHDSPTEESGGRRISVAKHRFADSGLWPV